MTTVQIVQTSIIVGLTIIALLFVWFKSKSWKKLFGDQQFWYVRTGILISIGFLALFGLLMVFLDSSNRDHLLTVVGIVASIGLALASTPFLSNAMAGIMLLTSGTFRPGDYIQVGEHFGRVTRRQIFHLTIQTPDRDLLTIPNLHVVSNPHKVMKADGTIIGCVVSLGYDVSHDVVEDAMITAALAAQLEEPFVEVQSLDDFSVVYRVAGLLTDVRYLISEQSNLRKLVMDALHSANIEIVSPTFMNQRRISDEKVLSEADLSRPAPPRRSRPEDLIFDDAEKAARVERLNDKLKKIKDDLEKLRSKELSDRDDPHLHQMTIMRKERDMKILENIIEEKSSDVTD